MKSLGLNSAEIRLHPNNALIEGPSDWVYLLTLAEILVEEEPKFKSIVNGEIWLRQCAGTEGINRCCPFFLQPGIKSIVFLDADEPGKRCKANLSARLGLPNDQIVDVFTINDVADLAGLTPQKTHEIEDLFGPSYYGEIVSALLGDGRLITESDFNGESSLKDQAVKIALEKWQIKFQADDVAWTFRRKLAAGELPEVPEEAKRRFRSILDRIVSSFD